MDRNIGFSFSLARTKASSPQGYHFTGLAACFRRYGLDSLTRWFVGAFWHLALLIIKLSNRRKKLETMKMEFLGVILFA